MSLEQQQAWVQNQVHEEFGDSQYRWPPRKGKLNPQQRQAELIKHLENTYHVPRAQASAYAKRQTDIEFPEQANAGHQSNSPLFGDDDSSETADIRLDDFSDTESDPFGKPASKNLFKIGGDNGPELLPSHQLAPKKAAQPQPQAQPPKPAAPRISFPERNSWESNNDYYMRAFRDAKDTYRNLNDEEIDAQLQPILAQHKQSVVPYTDVNKRPVIQNPMPSSKPKARYQQLDDPSNSTLDEDSDSIKEIKLDKGTNEVVPYEMPEKKRGFWGNLFNFGGEKRAPKNTKFKPTKPQESIPVMEDFTYDGAEKKIQGLRDELEAIEQLDQRASEHKRTLEIPRSSIS